MIRTKERKELPFSFKRFIGGYDHRGQNVVLTYTTSDAKYSKQFDANLSEQREPESFDSVKCFLNQTRRI
jgi:hypothetical protein